MSVSSSVTSGLYSSLIPNSSATSSAVAKSMLSFMVFIIPSTKSVLTISAADLPIFSLKVLIETGSVVITAFSMITVALFPPPLFLLTL